MVSKLLSGEFISLHSEYYLLAFVTTVLLSLNYLKFANKNKILPFRNFKVGNFQVAKLTSKTQRCDNVIITLWQRYPTLGAKNNQNPTLLQRHVPAGERFKIHNWTDYVNFIRDNYLLWFLCSFRVNFLALRSLNLLLNYNHRQWDYLHCCQFV